MKKKNIQFSLLILIMIPLLLLTFWASLSSIKINADDSDYPEEDNNYLFEQYDWGLYDDFNMQIESLELNIYEEIAVYLKAIHRETSDEMDYSSFPDLSIQAQSGGSYCTVRPGDTTNEFIISGFSEGEDEIEFSISFPGTVISPITIQCNVVDATSSDWPSYFTLIDDEEGYEQYPYDPIIMQPYTSVKFYIQVLEDITDYEIVIEEDYIEDQLTVEILEDYLLITAGEASEEAFPITIHLQSVEDKEVIFSQTYVVYIIEEQATREDSAFYFYLSNGEKIVEPIYLDLNSDVEYYIADENGQFIDCRVEFVCPSDLVADTASSGQISFNTGNTNRIFTILAKIYDDLDDYLMDSTVLTVICGTINGNDIEGTFYLEDYNFITNLEQLEISIRYYNYNNPTLNLLDNLTIEFLIDNEIGYFEYDQETHKIIFEPYRTGIANVTAVLIVNNKYAQTLSFNIRVVSGTESYEEYFNEGRLIQTLLSNGQLVLTIPQAYQDWQMDNEIIQISTNRNVADINFEQTGHHELQNIVVTLNGVGQTDIYLIYRNDYQQVIFKTTLSVINEESHIQIDLKRENDSSTAISIFDELTFSVNTLGYPFSSNLSYLWEVDGVEVSRDASYKAMLPAGSHTVKVSFTDNDMEKTFEAKQVVNVSKYQYQLRQIEFTEKEVRLLVLKNSYDLQVLLDGMISNEYQYTYSTENDTVQLFANGTSKLTILPNHSGQTTIYAFVDIGLGEEMIISAEITVIVDKLETIGFTTSKEFPKPGKPFDIILLANGRDDYKNTDFLFAATANAEPVTASSTQNGNIFTFADPVDAIYEFSYSLGSLNNKGSIKVTNFNFTEFLRYALPILVGIMIVVVIVYMIITAGLNPYRNITHALNHLENAYIKEIKKHEANPNAKSLTKAFKKLHHKAKVLMNRIHYFADEGFDGIENAIKSVITLDTALVALMHSMDTISSFKGLEALRKTYDVNFIAIKKLINQIIDSQLHYQKQTKENNKEELPKKEKKVKKIKIDYKKELYKNGILEKGEENADD